MRHQVTRHRPTSLAYRKRGPAHCMRPALARYLDALTSTAYLSSSSFFRADSTTPAVTRAAPTITARTVIDRGERRRPSERSGRPSGWPPHLPEAVGSQAAELLIDRCLPPVHRVMVAVIWAVAGCSYRVAFAGSAGHRPGCRPHPDPEWIGWVPADPGLSGSTGGFESALTVSATFTYRGSMSSRSSGTKTAMNSPSSSTAP